MLMSERLGMLEGKKVTVVLPPNTEGETNIEGTLKEVGDDCIVLSNWIPGVVDTMVPDCIIPNSAISIVFENIGK